MSHDNPLIRQWLHDLGKAVAEAMAGSDDVTETVQRIQDQGFSLYLVLDAKEDPKDQETKIQVNAPPDRPAEFRLGGEDVAFLRSMGIDPTRTGRKRRS